MNEKKLKQIRCQFNRCMISSEDFWEAKTYLDAITPNISLKLREAAIYAAVMAYCRPFTNNNGKNGKDDEVTPTVQTNLMKKFSTIEYSMHDNIMSIRNNILAHSNYKYKPARVFSESEDFLNYAVCPTSFYTENTEVLDVRIFYKMTEKMWQATRVEAHKLNKITHG